MTKYILVNQIHLEMSFKKPVYSSISDVAQVAKSSYSVGQK